MLERVEDKADKGRFRCLTQPYFLCPSFSACGKADDDDWCLNDLGALTIGGARTQAGNTPLHMAVSERLKTLLDIVKRLVDPQLLQTMAKDKAAEYLNAVTPVGDEWKA